MITPALAELHRLRRLGFRSEPILGEDGGVEVVCYMREHRNSREREVVLVYSENEARAYRTHSSVNDDNPFYVEPDATELIPLDDVVTVVRTLLSRPLLAAQHTLSPDSANSPFHRSAPIGPDQELAELLRHTESLLSNLAHHLPAGLVKPEKRHEAAELLESTATLLRADPPTVVDGPNLEIEDS